MAFDPFSNKLIPFSSFPIHSFWDDNEAWLTTANTPSGVSISEDDKNIYVEASLPGINPKDVDITFEKGYLWIKGEAKEEEENKKKKFYRRATKSFSYRVAVPGDVDLNVEPKAKSEHGVTKITFAKSAKATPKKIQLKVS